MGVGEGSVEVADVERVEEEVEGVELEVEEVEEERVDSCLLDSKRCKRNLLMSSALLSSLEGDEEEEDVCGGSRALFLLFTIQFYMKENKNTSLRIIRR